MIRALVPAKSLFEAKGRLASALTEAERRELALAMLTDVLTALLAVRQLDRVSVVSPDDDVRSLASSLGAPPIAESANVTGINQALVRALSAMSPQPDALLVVLGDLPEIDPEDIGRLLSELPERGAVAAPSDDGGTSALAVQPPDVMKYRFGPASFTAHREEARRVGVEFREVRLASLAHDIDSPDDLRRLASQPGTTATHEVVRRLGLAERLVGA
jgi:2-phospho-L-lactate guanylyltransferase